MSMQDTLADMFTRIRNAQMARKPDVEMPSSKQKQSIARVLQDEGYISGYEVVGEQEKPVLRVQLKYFEGEPVIDRISRVSRPGLRVYRGASEIPKVKNGLGIMIVSTNRGIMTDRSARSENLGGELLGEVS